MADHLNMGYAGVTRLAAAGMLVFAMGTAGCGAGDADRAADADAVGTVLAEEFGGHPLRDVPADGAPAVAVPVQPDPQGGWNVHLDTQRFTFTPEQVNGPGRVMPAYTSTG